MKKQIILARFKIDVSARLKENYCQKQVTPSEDVYRKVRFWDRVNSEERTNSLRLKGNDRMIIKLKTSASISLVIS